MSYNAAFNEIELAKHNYYRAQHGAPPMVINVEAARSAQAWTDRMSRSGNMQHSSRSERSDCGENLAMSSQESKMEKEAEATVMWYNEINNPGYNFSRGGYQSGAGHFTQVVWKGSTELGCGYRDGWVTCRYCNVAGNMMGDFDDNVLPLGTPAPGGSQAATPRRPTSPNTDSTAPATSQNVEKVPEGYGYNAAFNQIELAKHNYYRALHGAPPMVFDAEAAKSAQTWTEQMARSGNMQHSQAQQRNNCGENLAMSSQKQKMREEAEATVMWYDEVTDPGYSFGRGGYQSGTGHFTQVVWKGSTKLGCGYSDGWVTCRYCEVAGNMMGDFDDNVFPKGTPMPDGTKANPTDPVVPKKDTSPSSGSDDPFSGGGWDPISDTPATSNGNVTYKWNSDGSCTETTISQSRWGSSTSNTTKYGVSKCGDKEKPKSGDSKKDDNVTYRRNSNGSCTKTTTELTEWGTMTTSSTQWGATSCGDESGSNTSDDNTSKLCYTEEKQKTRCRMRYSLGQQTTQNCAESASSRGCTFFNKAASDSGYPCYCCIDGSEYFDPDTYRSDDFTLYKVNTDGKGTCAPVSNLFVLLAQTSHVVQSEDIKTQTSSLIQLGADVNGQDLSTDLGLVSMVNTDGEIQSLKPEIDLTSNKYDMYNTSTVVLTLLACVGSFTAYRKYSNSKVNDDAKFFKGEE